MNAHENPPSFVVRTEAEKATFDNGFRIVRGIENGWLHYASTTAKGDIWIAGASRHGPWFLSVDHPGVALEFGQATSALPGPGLATFVFSSLPQLYAAVERAYRLGVSLPDGPLERFRKRIVDLPRATEVERLVVQRVGQDIFRDALLKYWNGRCPMTGIADLALLRASHIVPWAECDDDAHRLDVHNGLLLSALWDAAFDAGLVSFSDNGDLLTLSKLGAVSRQVLLESAAPRLIGLTSLHVANLARHRVRAGL
jgi:HNH endonuclease